MEEAHFYNLLKKGFSMKSFALLFAFFSLGLCTSVHADSSQDACKKDIKKLCKNIKAGNGDVQSCLLENRQQLSTECKADLLDKIMNRKAAESMK